MAQAPVRFTRLPSSSVLKDCLITGNANNLQAPVSESARTGAIAWKHAESEFGAPFSCRTSRTALN